MTKTNNKNKIKDLTDKQLDNLIDNCDYLNHREKETSNDKNK